MRQRVGVVAAIVVAGVVPAQQPEPARAFVEVQCAADTVWLHQPCELRVLLGIDAEWFRQAAVPLFQRRLDQPFLLQVPWLLGAEDRAVELVPAAAGARTQRIAVGDREVAAVEAGARMVDGRRFELLELRYRWLPLAAGTSSIAPVELRYAFATRWEDDFLRGRQPLDRREDSVLSSPLRLAVRALPVAGRPAAFTGAVGEFTVAASTATQTVPVGGEFAVTLTIRGDGDLDRMAPLPPPALPGFHVRGVREGARAAGRASERTFELSVVALRAGAAQLPPIAFAAFSPRAGDYVVHHTAPLPLRVAPLPAGALLPPDVAQLVRADQAAVRAQSAWPWWTYAGATVALLAAGGGWWHRRRTRRADAELQAARADVDGAPERGSFERFCARRAGQAHFAGDATWAALAALGLPAPAVSAARAMHAAFDAARFGGVPPDPDAVRAVVRALGPR